MRHPYPAGMFCFVRFSRQGFSCINGLERRDLPTSTSLVLGLKVCFLSTQSVCSFLFIYFLNFIYLFVCRVFCFVF